MKRTCYLCGTPNPTTRDHIPPAGFFPSPRPSNLITVPCCEACNVSYSTDDDYFRLVMSSLLGRSPAGDRIWEEKINPHAVKRMPRQVDEILNSIEDVVLQTENGPVEAAAFRIDVPRLERYAIRLTKGLLAHHFPDHSATDWKFTVRFVPLRREALDFLAPYRDLLQVAERGDRVFSYRYGLSDTAQSGLWMLSFYEATLILIHHTALVANPTAVTSPPS